MARKPHPTDVKDDEREFVAPYLAPIREDAPQREHDLREIYNALRWIVRSGAPWRMIPNDLPPWAAVYQQVQRRIKAGVFEDIVHDLQEVLRVSAGREEQPTAVVIDSRTLQSTPESGHRAGCEGAKRRKGSKIHIAVDTPGHLLALHVTPADKQDRTQVKRTASAVQWATVKSVELAYVDQGYMGEQAEDDADDHGTALHVVKLPQAKRGFVLLPKRWVVERSFAWIARFRRLAKDFERLHKTVEGLHIAVFACVILARYFAESA
jgi:transposase